MSFPEIGLAYARIFAKKSECVPPIDYVFSFIVIRKEVNF